MRLPTKNKWITAYIFRDIMEYYDQVSVDYFCGKYSD